MFSFGVAYFFATIFSLFACRPIWESVPLQIFYHAPIGISVTFTSFLLLFLWRRELSLSPRPTKTTIRIADLAEFHPDPTRPSRTKMDPDPTRFRPDTIHPFFFR